MPIYEYSCQKCQAHIEILQKITDQPLTRCRKCGGKLEKQWSAPGIQFKGSGWYVTDYAGRKAEVKEEKKTKEEKKATGTESAKTGAEARPSKSVTHTPASPGGNTSGD